MASPQLLATLLILVSALLHAITNAIVKRSADGLLMRGCMNATAMVLALPFTLLVAAPAADMYLFFVTAVLIHWLYPFFLIAAYRLGDFSTVFPLARGTAPLGVFALSSGMLEQTLTWPKAAGVVIISFAVASFALERGAMNSRSRRRGMLLAFSTGLIIACYTIVDGIGVRIAQTPWTYIIWLFVLDGFCVSATVAALRRKTAVPFLARNWKSVLAASALGVTTYGLALYALSLGAIAEIAALRETSVVFAALIGSLVLGEAFGLRRVLASFSVAVGIVMMHITY